MLIKSYWNGNPLLHGFFLMYYPPDSSSYVSLDNVLFCKGLRLMGKKMNLVQQPLLCSLERILCSFHILVTRVWYVINSRLLKRFILSNKI